MATMDITYRIINQVVEQVKKDDGPPVSVAVCDKEGALAGFLKMDGSPARTIAFAQNKAYTAARMQVRTADFFARLKREGLDIAYFCDPKLSPLPGGSPLLNKSGEVVGSVGISGRSPEADQALADEISAQILRLFILPIN